MVSLTLGAALFLVLPLLAQRGPWVFDYGSAPSTGLVEARISSGLSGRSTEYFVSADGHVEISVLERGRERLVLETAEAQLGAQELREIVTDLVESGVASLNVRALEEQHRRLGQRLPSVSDGSTMTFEIHLDYFARGANPPESPYSHSFVISNPQWRSLYVPSQPEYASLKRLLDRLNQVYVENRRRVQR